MSGNEGASKSSSARIGLLDKRRITHDSDVLKANQDQVLDWQISRKKGGKESGRPLQPRDATSRQDARSSEPIPPAPTTSTGVVRTVSWTLGPRILIASE